MAQCPNCARTVRFWHNHEGFCSKQCRTESISSCPNCGKVGLFKHERLGCCSEDCRFWYVANLLGYDKEALLTPAWDKVVYHVRLPSNSAEISSLQFDELEYDRAIDTVLVIAAPAWMARSKVLAELPYERFDNAAWQHLWADGTLTEDELFRFHRLCYEDDMLCQKLGEHVYAKLRQPTPFYSAITPPPGYLEPAQPALAIPTRPVALLQAHHTGSQPATPDFVASVRTLFERRGYTVATGAAENTFILKRNGRTALAAYTYHGGMVNVDVVQRALAAGVAIGATQTFVVTNGRFTLQAEDMTSEHPIQLIDGAELASLVAERIDTPTIVAAGEHTPSLDLKVAGNGIVRNGDHHLEHTEVASVMEKRAVNGNGTMATTDLAPVDAEVIGDDGADMQLGSSPAS